MNGVLYNTINDHETIHRRLCSPINGTTDFVRPRSMCDAFYGPLLEYFKKRKSLDVIGTVPSINKRRECNGRPRSLPIDLKMPAMGLSESSSDEVIPAIKRRQFSRRGFRSKRKKGAPDPIPVVNTAIVITTHSNPSSSSDFTTSEINLATSALNIATSSLDSPKPIYNSNHYNPVPQILDSTTVKDSTLAILDSTTEVDSTLVSTSGPQITVDTSYLRDTPSTSVLSVNSDHFTDISDCSSSVCEEITSKYSGRKHKFKYGGTAPPSLRRSFETINTKRKLAVSSSLPVATSSLRLKADHSFKSLPYFPPVHDSASTSVIDFKTLESKRGGSIRRSLRSTFGSFKKLSKKQKSIKSVSVAGFVIQDRYLNANTWKDLSELEPREIRKRLPSENKVFENCPRIITQNDLLFGTFTDLRSLGLFLRPYQPYLCEEQYIVRLNFTDCHYRLYHELLDNDKKNGISCNVGGIQDMTSILGGDIAVPMLTVCSHIGCAISALQHTYCKGGALHWNV